MLNLFQYLEAFNKMSVRVIFDKKLYQELF